MYPFLNGFKFGLKLLEILFSLNGLKPVPIELISLDRVLSNPFVEYHAFALVLKPIHNPFAIIAFFFQEPIYILYHSAGIQISKFSIKNL